MRLSAVPPAIRARFIAWGVAMLTTLALFATQVLPNLKIETDILALLPNAQQDPAMDAALNDFSAQLARRQIFLIGAADVADAKLAARSFARVLEESGAFASIAFELDARARERFDVYLHHRSYLLTDSDEQALREGRGTQLVQKALRSAYTPAGLMQPLSLAQDPLGLLNNFLRAQIPAFGAARLDGANLVVDAEEGAYVLVLAESSGSPFASAVQERVMPAIDAATQAARRAVPATVTILSSGAIQHATAATQRATYEVSAFGTIETLAVIVLLWTMFGGVRPLVLAMLTLSLAVMAAFTVVHFWFGTVHLLALVFGSSLIGSIIDYSIHFFADRFREPQRWSPVAAVSHVGPAILLGLAATLTSYLVLAFVPFPGLKQIAVFCMVGLLVGAGCVLCFYPMFTRVPRGRTPQLGPRLGKALDRFLLRWRWTPVRGVVVALVIGLAVAGLSRAYIQDDIRALQVSPPELVQSEQQVRELLGSTVESRFFLVSGESEQAVLERERTLTQALDRLIAEDKLSSYQAVSTSLPPLERQQSVHELLREQVFASGGLLEQAMRALGYPSETIAERRHELETAYSPLTPQEWLASPASQAVRHLWLGRVGDRHANVVSLGGIRDVDAIHALAGIDGVQLIDRVAGTTQVLSQYRQALSGLLALIYALAGVLLAARFGLRAAPRILLPSILATLTTLGVFGWLGVPINLFTMLALWLALGLGIDYGIFLRHGLATRPTAILSVTLSACTTLLAFGLLSFSATPFIRSIGVTLLCAITLSWLFALFSCLTALPRRTAEMEIKHG